MSDLSVAMAQALVASQADATRAALQTQMLRQQAQSELAVVDMLAQAVSANQAVLPEGQGGKLDKTV
jgi:hypothetical protein